MSDLDKAFWRGVGLVFVAGIAIGALGCLFVIAGCVGRVQVGPDHWPRESAALNQVNSDKASASQPAAESPRSTPAVNSVGWDEADVAAVRRGLDLLEAQP